MEAKSETPRAILGLTDLEPRMAVRGLLGKDILTLTVPIQDVPGNGGKRRG